MALTFWQSVCQWSIPSISLKTPYSYDTAAYGSRATGIIYPNDTASTVTYTSVSGSDVQYILKYDVWNRLTKVKDLAANVVVTFAYDGRGWRTKETASGTTTDLYYSTDWQILEERTGVTSPSRVGTVKTQNVWSPVYVGTTAC